MSTSFEKIVWLTAYAVDNMYGGPEEGGWWYERGTRICAVPVTLRGKGILVEWDEDGESSAWRYCNGHDESSPEYRETDAETQAELEAYDRDLYNTLIAHEYDTSCDRIELRWGVRPGRSFPAERPHYE